MALGLKQECVVEEAAHLTAVRNQEDRGRGQGQDLPFKIARLVTTSSSQVPTSTVSTTSQWAIHPWIDPLVRLEPL
jgi:hypothetical protein